MKPSVKKAARVLKWLLAAIVLLLQIGMIVFLTYAMFFNNSFNNTKKHDRFIQEHAMTRGWLQDATSTFDAIRKGGGTTSSVIKIPNVKEQTQLKTAVQTIRTALQDLNIDQLSMVSYEKDFGTMDVNFLPKGDYAQVMTSLQFQSDDSWHLFSAEYFVNEKTKNKYLFSIELRPLSEPLQVTNQVNLHGISKTRLITLLIVYFVAFLILASLILLIKSDRFKHKMLWGLFIISGITSIHFDWTTQHYLVNSVSVQFFGFAFSRYSPYGPLHLKFSLPLGAFLFLLVWFWRRRKAKETTIQSHS